MKSFKMVAAVATVLMTTGAFAQTTPATSSAAMPAAAAPATSTASLDEAKKDVVARPWKVELYHSTETAMSNITYNKGVSKTQNFIGFKSKVLGTRSLGIRQIISANYMADEKRSDLHMGNTYIHYTDPKLYALANGVEATGILRLYMPTGETARFNSKDNGSVRAYFINAKSIGKWDFDVTLMGQAWANTIEGYTMKGTFVDNADYYFTPSLNAGYNVSPALSLGLSAGTENFWYRSAKKATRSADLTTSVAWQALPQLKLIASVADDVVFEGDDLQDRGFVPFRDDETTVLLEASIAL